jgi:5-(hydroxymethyl)furfural/furfural oxidase
MMIDYLILGGGTAGCALAARLSEDPDKAVVLIEAGRDLRSDAMADNIRTRYPGLAYLDAQNLWTDLSVTVSGAATREPNRTPRRYEQARVLGGGSAINAMVANRGAPGDYDEWGALGAEGWSGEVALKYFRKLERDCDIDDQWHGKSGPIPVRRHNPERTSPFIAAVCRSLVAKGYPMRADQNGEWADGVFPAVIATTDDGERIPASIAYLTPEVRRRSNLRIITDTQADVLLFDGGRVVGASLVPSVGAGDADRAQGAASASASQSVSGSASSASGSDRANARPDRLLAAQTIVCCGGIHSSALLMRSGIGAAAELTKLGIPVHANLRGVGQNLMEHPLTAVSTYLPPASRIRDLREHHDQALLRYSSKLGDAPAGDMHIAMIGRTAWHSVGQRMGTLLIWVNKSYSRGNVTLRSADSRAEPVVDFKLLSDERDFERLKQGFRLAAGILRDPALDKVRGSVFPTSYSERVRKVSAPGAVNALQMNLLGKMLDYAGGMRDSLVHQVITLGLRVDDLLADEAKLHEFIGNSVAGVWHASGTCKMGAAGDPMAVTDGAGRVHGVAGLRVCDSSIMPSIPRANTNMPTLMLTERIADLIKEEAAQRVREVATS